MMRYITLWLPTAKAVEVLSTIGRLRPGITWSGGQALASYCPEYAHTSSIILYIGEHNKVLHAGRVLNRAESTEFSVQDCSDEVTVSAFNLLGQDLDRTANFLWEQGYTQQLIDKLINGTTVEELLSRGDSNG